MNRFRTLAAASLVSALAVGALSQPAPAAAACETFCIPLNKTTVIVSGTGSSCANAQASLTAQLQDLADAGCTFDLGYCNFAITITRSCFQLSNGSYRVKGYATYGCLSNYC